MKKNLIFKKYLSRPEYVFLLIMIIVGSVYALLIPAGGGPDESSHLARAYAIAHGNLTANAIETRKDTDSSNIQHDYSETVLYGGLIDKGLVNVAASNTHSLQKQDKYVWTFPTWKDKNSDSSERVGRGKTEVAYSNAAVNFPLVYSPHALGYWAARLFTDNAYAIIVLMRFFGLISATILIFFSIKVIPFGKWLTTAVSLSPIVIAEFSTITADSITYAICVAFIAFLMKLLCSHPLMNRKRWLIMACLSIALACIKLAYVPLLGLLVLLPILHTEFRQKQALIKLAIIAAATSTVFLSWYLKISQINTGAMFGSVAYPSEQKFFIMSHPAYFLKLLMKQFLNTNIFSISDFGVVGLHNTMFANIGWISMIGLIFAFACKDSREKISGNLQQRAGIFYLISAGIFVVISALIGIALYLQYTAPGFNEIQGVQSRYYSPVLLLILLPALVLFFPRQVNSSEDRSSGNSYSEKNDLIGNWATTGLQVVMGMVDCVVLAYSLY